MSHKPNHVPKLSHNKASGKGVVRLSGVDVYCGVFGTEECQRNYDKAIADWLARGRTPPPPKVRGEVPLRAGTTVNEVVNKFRLFAIDYYRGPDGKHTNQFHEYRLTIRAIRQNFDCMKPATEFGPLALKTVREAMVRDGLSRGEVNRRIGLAKRIFRWAASEEMIPAEVFHRLATVSSLQKGRTSAPETEPVEPVEEWAVNSTLPFLTAQVRGLIEFMRWTGCRPGEACVLRWRDVVRSGDVWEFTPHRHKGSWRGKSRKVMIGKRAQRVLADFLDVPDDEYVFSPRRAVAQLHAARTTARQTPLYPSHEKNNEVRKNPEPKRPPRDCYNPGGVFVAVSRAIGKANAAFIEAAVELEFHVPHWHPNQLRHTVATAVRKRFGLESAGAVLGHAKVSVTEIYAERDAQLAVRIASEMG